MPTLITNRTKSGRILSSDYFVFDKKIKKQLDDVVKRDNVINQTSLEYRKAVPIEKRIQDRTIEIRNRGLEQDIKLKKWSLIILFIFLAIETLAIFLFAFLQALKFKNFHLEEWSFKLLVAATITQITLMLRVAITHLFPNQKGQ